MDTVIVTVDLVVQLAIRYIYSLYLPTEHTEK